MPAASPEGGSLDGASHADGLSPANSALPLMRYGASSGALEGGDEGGEGESAGAAGAGASGLPANLSPSPHALEQHLPRIGSPPLGTLGTLSLARRESLLSGDSDMEGTQDSEVVAHALAAATVALGLRDDAPGQC